MSIPLGRPGVSFTEVATVAERLTTRGDRVTAQAIRAELGSGSLGTIQKHVTAWRAGQRTVKAESDALPADLQRALVAHIEHRVSEARAVLEAELTECQGERETLASELERQATELSTAIERIQQQNTDLARQGGSIATLESALSEARAQADKERQAAEEARKASALAELRLENLETLRTQLSEEREARRRAEIETAELRGRHKSVSK